MLHAQHIEQVGDAASALVWAHESGDGWELLKASVDFFSALNTVLGERVNFGEYTDEFLTAYSVVDKIASIVNLAEAIQDFASALETGDEWGILRGTTALVQDSFIVYDTFQGLEFQSNGTIIAGAATSLAGLAINIDNLIDSIGDGDTIDIMRASLNVLQNACYTYVAVGGASAALAGTSAFSASAGAFSDSLPAIGLAIGIAQGLLSIADGDVYGGAEQIAVSGATYALSCIPVYGWIGAIVLQLGYATRGCDGRIIDEENIADFSDNFGPGAGKLASLSMEAFESFAQLHSDVYDGTSYLSGANLHMWRDMGVDVPKEMEADFELAQIFSDANNPFRYTQYFTDLEDLSLSDFWDSTYITQTVVGIVDHVKNWPDSIESHLKHDPELAFEMFKSAITPDGIITMIKGLFGGGSAPSATASFAVAENGDVVMLVSGDSEMAGTAEYYGSAVLAVMQQYKDGGDRLVIDGSIPSLKVENEKGTCIQYTSEYGGSVQVDLPENVNPAIYMYNVLIGRDRGDRLDDAVKLARNASGDINLDQVAHTLAGFGFTRQGINFTYGEDNSDRIGHASGTGVFAGGGNAGPEGQLFTARKEDVRSLPLREEQLPKQLIGDVLKISGLNMFSGLGAELLAMAMILPGGLIGVDSAMAAGGEHWAGDDELIVPLNGFELASYLKGDTWMIPAYEDEAADAFQFPVDLLNDTAGVQEFLSQYWTDLSDLISSSAVVPDGVYYFNDDGSVNAARSSMASPLAGTLDEEDDLYSPVASSSVAADEALVTSETRVSSLTGGESFSAIQVPPELFLDSVPLPPGIEQGSSFIMAEDSTLRILASELAEDTLSGQASFSEDQYTFVSLGAATNGFRTQ